MIAYNHLSSKWVSGSLRWLIFPLQTPPSWSELPDLAEEVKIRLGLSRQNTGVTCRSDWIPSRSSGMPGTSDSRRHTLCTRMPNICCVLAAVSVFLIGAVMLSAIWIFTNQLKPPTGFSKVSWTGVLHSLPRNNKGQRQETVPVQPPERTLELQSTRTQPSSIFLPSRSFFKREYTSYTLGKVMSEGNMRRDSDLAARKVPERHLLYAHLDSVWPIACLTILNFPVPQHVIDHIRLPSTQASERVVSPYKKGVLSKWSLEGTERYMWQ